MNWISGKLRVGPVEQVVVAVAEVEVEERPAVGALGGDRAVGIDGADDGNNRVEGTVERVVDLGQQGLEVREAAVLSVAQ